MDEAKSIYKKDIEDIKKDTITHKVYLMDNVQSRQDIINILKELKEMCSESKVDMQYLIQGTIINVSYLNLGRGNKNAFKKIRS